MAKRNDGDGDGMGAHQWWEIRGRTMVGTKWETSGGGDEATAKRKTTIRTAMTSCVRNVIGRPKWEERNEGARMTARGLTHRAPCPGSSIIMDMMAAMSEEREGDGRWIAPLILSEPKWMRRPIGRIGRTQPERMTQHGDEHRRDGAGGWTTKA